MNSSIASLLSLALVALFSFPLVSADDLISPGCTDEFNTYQDCFETNLNVCFSCISDEEPVDADVCSYIPIFCEELSCCGPCISLGKAFVACESDTRGCGATCDEVQPVAPSPVAPVAFSSPAFFSPVAPTVPGPCDDISGEYGFCIFTNLFISPCFESCSDILAPEEESQPETCEELVTIGCPQITCCPACAAIGNRLVACLGEELFGCAGASCGEFAPVAPSPVAPSAFPPGLFFLPTSPIAAPIAAPFAPPPAAAVGKSDSSSDSSSDSEDRGKKGENKKKDHKRKMGKKGKRVLRNGN